MTLQDLLDELSALPASARTARVGVGDLDSDILSVAYAGGEVVIRIDEAIGDDETEDA
jgi:hypothetical protein